MLHTQVRSAEEMVKQGAETSSLASWGRKFKTTREGMMITRDYIASLEIQGRSIVTRMQGIASSLKRMRNTADAFDNEKNNGFHNQLKPIRLRHHDTLTMHMQTHSPCIHPNQHHVYKVWGS
jgi:hypothetical protein